MALQYTTVSELDLGAGEDSRSSEDALQPGFWEQLLNAEAVERRIRKRKGYQQRSGYLPVRVQSVEYSTGAPNLLELVLDGSIDTSALRTHPVYVYGRTSGTSGLDTAEYFSGFINDPRVDIPAGPNTTVLQGSFHNLGTPFLWVGSSESLSPTTFSHLMYTPGELTIDQSSFDLDIETDADSAFSSFFFFKDVSAVPGSIYQAAASLSPGANTVSIPTSTHNLSNFNILVQAYHDTGAEYIRLIPDAVRIDASSGDVEVDLTNGEAGSIDVVIGLVAADTGDVFESSVARNNPATLAPTTSTAVIATDNPWAFFSIYLRDAGTGNRTLVLPDSVEYDAASGEHTITFKNASSSNKVVEIFWTFGDVVSNRLILESVDSRWGASDYTDDTPQLTLWGLDHDLLYDTDSSPRGGWSVGIDGYRRAAEQRLAVVFGGNLYTERAAAELSSIPVLYSRLRNRSSSDLRLSPLFHDTGEEASRTRGYITGDDLGDHHAEVTSVTYDSGTGYSDYLLSIPNKTILASDNVTPALLSDVISVDTDKEDYLTVGDMGWAVHNGTFRIVEVEDVDATTIRIRVDNPRLSDPDCDEVDAGGRAAVWTDQIPLSSSNEFVVGDRVYSSAYSSSLPLFVVTGDASVLVVGDVTSGIDFAAGVLLSGSRTSAVVPSRDAGGNVTTEFLIPGDSLGRPDLFRKLRVKYINNDTDRSVLIDSNGDTATIVLTSGTTSHLTVGQKIFLHSAGLFSGEHTITDITTSTAFTVSSSLVVSGQTGTFVGGTFEVDEDLEWTDTVDNSQSYTPTSRWIPVEHPDDNWDLTPNQVVSYWKAGDYDNKPFVRSTMVNDTLFFTNNQDEVLKYDGTSVYRAGLFRWQPGHFVTIDTSATAKILANSPSITAGAIGPENSITVTAGDETAFQIGDRVRYEDGVNPAVDLLITDFDFDNNKIIFNKNLALPDGTVLNDNGDLTRLTEYRYYYRLNAIDANDNIVASGYTGLEDFRVRIGANAAIHHRLVGMPVWDIYDYDRIEVEIYRTVGDGPPVFYRITNLPLSFDADNGYIDFVDTVSDDELVGFPTDPTALLTDPGGLGPELSIAAGWREPLKAKYITSAGNRLVLGHLTDYPQLDIQLYDQLSVLSQSDLLGKIWSFRRDNNDTSSISNDMENSATYEWLDDSSALTVGSVVVGVGTVTYDVGSAPPVAAGDWIYAYNSTPLSDNNPVAAGWFRVDSVGATTIVVASDISTSVVPSVDRIVYSATDATRVPVLLGADGNRESANGNSGLVRFVAMKRLGEAINSSMRQITTTPWLIANYGGEFNAGQLLVRLPRTDPTTPEVILDSTVTNEYDVFINSIRRSPGSEASMIERVYPSRIIHSYDNFPEIFENPTAVSATDSLYVRDINSADGQELTNVYPFFGDSVSRDSQQEGILLAFKQNSVYAYNSGNTSPPQRLETQGLGCTAPYSVASSHNGINFANDSGIYQITRSLGLRYVGRYEERNWQELVDKDQLDLVHGHHFSQGRQYKLSVVAPGESRPDGVFVYDHTREVLADGASWGAWSRYDNHPATGWTNLGQDAFFGSTRGRVFSVRRALDDTDYRDDDQAISMVARLREMDFGNSGARKTLAGIISHFRNISDTCCIQLKVNTETRTDGFQTTDNFVLTGPLLETTNMSDVARGSISSIRSNTSRRKFLYLQAEYSNNQIDEPVELSKVDFRVALADHKGIQEAADTTS